jgi:ribosome-binding protein aMBF1 (putative translation factor)
LVVPLRISIYPDRTLGECIKKSRVERGLFQSDLAKMIGVDEMTTVNGEKGRTKPREKNLERLQKLLGVESLS